MAWLAMQQCPKTKNTLVNWYETSNCWAVAKCYSRSTNYSRLRYPASQCFIECVESVLSSVHRSSLVRGGFNGRPLVQWPTGPQASDVMGSLK